MQFQLVRIFAVTVEFLQMTCVKEELPKHFCLRVTGKQSKPVEVYHLVNLLNKEY